MQRIHDTNEKEAKQEEKNLDLITSPQAKEKIYRFFFIIGFSLINSPNVAHLPGFSNVVSISGRQPK